MKRWLPLALFLLVPLAASASPIQYTIDETFKTVTEVGTITTDGLTGMLTAADILGFDIVVTDPDGSVRITSILGSDVDQGTDLLADASGLYFDFDGAAGDYFALENYSNTTSICFGACEVKDATRLGAYVKDGPAVLSAARSGLEEIGTAETVAATPEPGGLVLLGTGLLGVVGVVRRRVFEA